MNRFAMIVGALLVAPPAADAQTPYTCGTGTLRDVEAITETVATPTQTHVRTKRNKRGDREVWSETTSGERREKRYVVQLQLDDMLYTAESSGNFWNFDPTRLVINDSIGVCVDGKRIILRRPDGKDYKAKIVRAVRNGK